MNSNILSFQGTYFGYSFSVLSPGWIQSPRIEQEIMGADLLIDHESLGVIKILVSPFDGSFETLSHHSHDAYSKEVDDFRLITKSETTVAGNRAVFIEYDGVDKHLKERISVISHIFIKNGHVFQILGLTYPNNQNLKPEIETVINSFTFSPNFNINPNDEFSELIKILSTSDKNIDKISGPGYGIAFIIILIIFIVEWFQEGFLTALWKTVLIIAIPLFIILYYILKLIFKKDMLFKRKRINKIALNNNILQSDLKALIDAKFENLKQYWE